MATMNVLFELILSKIFSLLRTILNFNALFASNVSPCGRLKILNAKWKLLKLKVGCKMLFIVYELKVLIWSTFTLNLYPAKIYHFCAIFGCVHRNICHKFNLQKCCALMVLKLIVENERSFMSHNTKFRCNKFPQVDGY